tara:strand:+ start:91831 stop:92991 length:1161 start_codon:yes stop_codon:yes gene_type:complete
MAKKKLVRITTVPQSLEKLLEGQLRFMSDYYDVTAVSANKSGLEQYGTNEEVPTFYLNLTRKITPVADLRALYKLYRFLRREKPLIVHTHTPKAGIVGMSAAYLARIPLRLHTVAGLPLMEAKGFKRLILNFVEKLTYRFATNVYPNSKGLYDFIISERFTEPNKLKVIGKGSSNGIDTSYFNPSLYSEKAKAQLRDELNIPQNDFIFLFVGRLVKDKGINELVNAFIKYSEENRNISLLLVGPFEEELDPIDQETSKAITSSGKIVSVGFQKDVRPFFSISNVLTFPSYREGFPNVVMQAGAMGLPSIVSNINGCNEIITHNHNGLIIPVKDEIAIYNAMISIVENNELFMSLSGNARSIIVSNYERKEVWDFLLNEYHQLEAKL